MDAVIVEQVNRKKHNLFSYFIYANAFYPVPQNCLLKILEVDKISDKIRSSPSLKLKMKLYV